MKLIRFTLLVAGLGAAIATATFAQNRVFTNQYTFGDSLSDSGNLYAATGRGGPPYFQGRFSNGRVWTELLGSNMALTVTAAPTVRSSMNFAFVGAAAGGSSTLPPSLGVQIGMFRQRGITPGTNDLFTVFAGANDLIDTLSAPTTPANPASLDIAGASTAQAAAAGVQTLVSLGARNFVVAGLPNLGATPKSMAAGGPGGAGASFGLRATNAFNNELRSRLQAITAAASDVNLIYLDVQGVLDRVLGDYRAFGFTTGNTTGFLSTVEGPIVGTGDPNNYVFFDDIHPTAKMHALLGAIVTEQLNPEPVVGFAGTLGSAALALQGIGAAAFDSRASQIGFTPRRTGRGDAYATFNYGDGRRATDSWRPGFDYTAQVVTAGFDTRLSDGVLGGAALNVGRLNASVKGGGGSFTVEDAGGRLYAVWRGGPVALTVDGDYGLLTVKGIHRSTALGGLATNGKTAGQHWGLGLKAAWGLDLGGTAVRPWVGLRRHHVNLDAYSEKDVPALSMDFADQTAESTSGAIGVDTSLDWKLGGRSVRFDLRGAWHGELGSSSRRVTGKLANNFTRSTVVSLEDGDGSGLELGGAATLFFAKNWSASLGYAADIRTSEKVANRATLSLQTGF